MRFIGSSDLAKAFQDTRHKLLTAKEHENENYLSTKKSVGLVFIAISSGIKSFGTLLSPNLLFLCLTTYIEYVIRHCHKIPPCKRI